MKLSTVNQLNWDKINTFLCTYKSRWILELNMFANFFFREKNCDVMNIFDIFCTSTFQKPEYVFKNLANIAIHKFLLISNNLRINIFCL